MRIDQAIEELERALATDPGNTEAVHALALLYIDRGDPKSALAKLRAIFNENPGDLPTLELLAKAFEALALPEKARQIHIEIARIRATSGG